MARACWTSQTCPDVQGAAHPSKARSESRERPRERASPHKQETRARQGRPEHPANEREEQKGRKREVCECDIATTVAVAPKPEHAGHWRLVGVENVQSWRAKALDGILVPLNVQRVHPGPILPPTSKRRLLAGLLQFDPSREVLRCAKLLTPKHLAEVVAIATVF